MYFHDVGHTVVSVGVTTGAHTSLVGDIDAQTASVASKLWCWY